MPFTDHYNTSAFNLSESKALAADRLFADTTTAPAPKEDFSKVFARVHKPREPERQEIAAQDKSQPADEVDRPAKTAPSRDTTEASDPNETGRAPAVTASAKAQLMRLLRALQLTGDVLGGAAGPNGEALKAAQLSESVSVITAGPAPTESELLAYAKELGLLPEAIEALMAQLRAEGLLRATELESTEIPLNPDVRAKGSDSYDGFDTTQDALIAVNSLVAVDNTSEAKDLNEDPSLPPRTAVFDEATSRWLSQRGHAGYSPEPSSATGMSGQQTAGLKADGSGLGQSSPDQSPKDANTFLKSSADPSEALTKVEKLLGPGGLKEMLAGKAAERAMANEAIIKSALMKEVAVGPQGFETIDLSEFAAEFSNPLDRPSLSAPMSASAPGAFGVQSSMTDASGRGLGGETAGRQDGQGGSARAFSAQLSQRFGEILGQRLLQQISQGNWKVELNLEPGDLGSIKVEMEFKKGELEASFKAGQAMTKDLLQDTLPRLREALERSGITIASMNVGGDRQERSGDSLSHQNPSTSGRRQPDGLEGDDVELEKVVAHRSHDGALDVWV